MGEECRACREGVAVFNMSYFGKFFLTGPDAQKAVDWIFTNNMQKKPGTYQKLVTERCIKPSELNISFVNFQFCVDLFPAVEF